MSPLSDVHSAMRPLITMMPISLPPDFSVGGAKMAALGYSSLVGYKLPFPQLGHRSLHCMPPISTPTGLFAANPKELSDGLGVLFPGSKSTISRSYGGKRTGSNGRTWRGARALAAVVEKQESPLKSETGTWTWSFEGNPVKIYFEEHKGSNHGPCKDILMIPTISDVSTVEEWRAVANDLLVRKEASNWRVVIVDWPGLGFSERPSINYNADVMEQFLVDFLSATDGPFRSADGKIVLVGGGHAATLAVRAAGKGLLSASAIVAVAPTWAGPLPIVFGRDSKMETRYGLLRGALRAPALGWMVYNVLVSNQKSIQSQYESHVYADPKNVTPSIVESRYALTKREGARYAPAAFLTGLLDPVQSREEFLALFAELESKVPILVMSTKNAPKRSKSEMEALQGAKGVCKFVEVPGALLPQEEYPHSVSDELFEFLKELLIKVAM